MKKCCMCKTKYDMLVYFCSSECLSQDWALHKGFHAMLQYIEMSRRHDSAEGQNMRGLLLLVELSVEKGTSETVIDTNTIPTLVSIARSHDNPMMQIIATTALCHLASTGGGSTAGFLQNKKR